MSMLAPRAPTGMTDCCPLPSLAVTPEILQTLLSRGDLEGLSEGPLSYIVSSLRAGVTGAAESAEEEGKPSGHNCVAALLLSCIRCKRPGADKHPLATQYFKQHMQRTHPVRS